MIFFEKDTIFAPKSYKDCGVGLAPTKREPGENPGQTRCCISSCPSVGRLCATMSLIRFGKAAHRLRG